MDDKSGWSSWIPCVSAYWRSVSCLMDSHSVPCQSGAQAHSLDGGIAKWCQTLPPTASWEKSHDVTQAGLDLRSSCFNLPDARDLDISPVPSLCNLKHPSKTVIEVAFWITWLPSFSRGWHLKDFISWGLVLLRYPEVSVTHLLLLPVYQIPVVSNHRSASFPKFQENGSWNKWRTKVVSNIKQHCLNE